MIENNIDKQSLKNPLQTIFSFFTQNEFRKEITIVIILKLIALFLIWQLCFV